MLGCANSQKEVVEKDFSTTVLEIAQAYLQQDSKTLLDLYGLQIDTFVDTNGCNAEEVQVYTEKDVAKAVVPCGERQVLLTMEMQEEAFKSFYANVSNTTIELSENEYYYEERIAIGKQPQIQGIITYPKMVEYPRIAVLVGNLDESANTTSKEDLAHFLAQYGIASVRYDMRLNTEGYFLKRDGVSLDEIYFRDFAYLVHHLEEYPVDASRILFVGYGDGSSLAFTSVYHHFEISGGIVLFDPTYDDGLLLMNDYFNQKELDASYDTKQWEDVSGMKYFNYLKQPILILQSKNGNTEWEKCRSGKNVTYKRYEKLVDHLEEDGVYIENVKEDFLLWLSGLPLSKEEKQ